MDSFFPPAPTWVYSTGASLLFIIGSVILNALWQQLPRPKSEPPLVFHWLPFIGNAVSYGTDPYRFYSRCREKHGDVFTFVLFGRRMTVFLGVQGNDFILNGKLQDLNAEEIYSPLTTPVFGSDIIYDCPNSKLMEQKKFVKFGLTQKALDSYVPLIEKEVLDYIASSPVFQTGSQGIVDIPSMMAEITIFTASRTLQGPEVRKKLTGDFAKLYHDLDLGFRPINFLAPWAPLPQNRRRDVAHARMRDIYMDLINQRRRQPDDADQEEEPDMIRHLMSNCIYKNGQALPDKEIAHMMITLLMAGQHSSSSSSAWTMLRLASRPDVAEEVYQEVQRLGRESLQHSDLDKLPLLANVVKETLRMHSSIHSIMRRVKRPMRIPGSNYVVTPGKVLVSAPIMMHLDEENFRNALVWEPHRWDDDTVEATARGDDEIVDYGYGATSKGTKSPYLPFGAGRHRCIGEKFAYLNLATIVSTLVRNFKFSTLDGKATVPPTDYTSMFSRPTQPALVRWERRNPKAA
ncbi:hypothetical protein PspLS_08601 [Pyricularia sp. CBS 133598]|nr:hypothetical protein PspLS_08601 [Pyricularia sp. CBS 133598]